MAKTDNLTEFLTGIADVIREVKGASDLINPQNFRSEIEGFSAEQPQLYAPTIELSDSYLNITNNANNGSFVEYFDVYVNGSKQESSITGTATQFIWSDYVGEPGAVTVAARGTYFIDSNLSNEVSIGADLMGGLYSTDGSFTSWSRLVSDGIITVDGTTVSDANTLMTGELVLPNNNSVQKIGASAFSGCDSLTSIKIPQAITVIENRAFNGCTNLSTVDISENIQSIGSDVFLNCNNLNYNIYNSVKYLGNTNNKYVIAVKVTDTNLTTATLHDQTICICGGAFAECNKLSSITMPFVGMRDGGSNKNDYLGYMFGSPGSSYQINYIPTTLRTVVLTSATMIPGSAFYGCTSLTSITIPDSVESIESQAFYNCSGLTNITIPDSVTSIGRYAFSGCSGLTNITIPDSVTSIESYAFQYCTNLKQITSPALNISIGNLFNTTKVTNLQTVNITSGTSLVDYAFRYCENITSLTLPNTITSIGKMAFYDLINLPSITIPDSVTHIKESAFTNCNNLLRINITSLSNWCKIVFDGDTANPLSNEKSKLYINNSSATSLTIPTDVTTINDYAFLGYTQLTNVSISNNVTHIGYCAFYKCSGLRTITIPSSVTSIGGYAFRYCSGLTTITIANGIFSLDSGIFRNCTNLQTITIPVSVTTIGTRMLEDCTKLTRINYGGTKEQWNNIDFGNDWNDNTGTYTVYCTDGNITKSA